MCQTNMNELGLSEAVDISGSMSFQTLESNLYCFERTSQPIIPINTTMQPITANNGILKLGHIRNVNNQNQLLATLQLQYTCSLQCRPIYQLAPNRVHSIWLTTYSLSMDFGWVLDATQRLDPRLIVCGSEIHQYYTYLNKTYAYNNNANIM